jgi:carbon monoxide dehydrogenase subunit G
MILTDEVQIPLDRNTVFQALNDPEILKQSIPGCEEIKSHSETELEATVVVKFGPVKASFNSNVELDPSGGPEQFKLNGSGDAGVAGFAKGGADVQLTENDEGTLLNYEVNIDISGKLAQVGSRLIEGTSKRLAKKFFVNFEEALANRHT